MGFMYSYVKQLSNYLQYFLKLFAKLKLFLVTFHVSGRISTFLMYEVSVAWLVICEEYDDDDDADDILLCII